MDRGLKERLVGAAVLVALAVIFIPMLLDDSPSGPGPITETNIPEHPDETDGFSSRIIPVAPEPVEVELPEPPVEEESPAPAAGATQSETAGQPEEPAEVAPAETEPPAKKPASAETAAGTREPASPKPSGWVIQLGSFTREENARDLNEKLRKAGHPAFVEPAIQDGTKVFRVRVGPEVMRGEAEKLRDRIAADFDIKGIVISYP